MFAALLNSNDDLSSTDKSKGAAFTACHKRTGRVGCVKILFRKFWNKKKAELITHGSEDILFLTKFYLRGYTDTSIGLMFIILITNFFSAFFFMQM
jgi:hypothetical protein